MDRYELAWAAGFFDGEGWANAVGHADRATKQPHAQVNQAGAGGVPDTLRRFQSAVGGLGRIGGPYANDGRKDLYSWIVSSRPDVELLHHCLLPWLGEVKLKEFADALGRPAASSRRPQDNDGWLHWAAGLFDGEGWFSMYAHRSHLGYLSPEVGVGQSSASGRPEVLVRFRSIIGRGRIYGPYEQRGATMPVYRWKATARGDVLRAAELLLPVVGAMKRADGSLLCEILAAQPELPRGNPMWGNRKTHCFRGHEYATARLRPYRSRGVGKPRRDSHQCLVCVREQARARRAERKSAADDDRRSISEECPRYLLK